MLRFEQRVRTLAALEKTPEIYQSYEY